MDVARHVRRRTLPSSSRSLYDLWGAPLLSPLSFGGAIVELETHRFTHAQRPTWLAASGSLPCFRCAERYGGVTLRRCVQQRIRSGESSSGPAAEQNLSGRASQVSRCVSPLQQSEEWISTWSSRAFIISLLTVFIIINITIIIIILFVFTAFCGGNVGRRMVVARSNCSLWEWESSRS